MIEKQLFTALKTVCDRVYPMVMPDDAVCPFIIYQVIIESANQATNGNLSSRDVRFQVDIFSKSYGEAKSLKDLVFSEVIGLKGGDLFSKDLYENEIELFRQLIDFKIKRT